MNLEELKPLLEKVRLRGQMPSPFLSMAEGKCKNSMGSISFAHAHMGIGIRNRGKICFTPKGLERPDSEVIRTLAHELTHLRYPRRAHRNPIFTKSITEFLEELNG